MNRPVIRFHLHRREEGDWVLSFERSVGVDDEGSHIFRYVACSHAYGYRAMLRWMWTCMVRYQNARTL